MGFFCLTQCILSLFFLSIHLIQTSLDFVWSILHSLHLWPYQNMYVLFPSPKFACLLQFLRFSVDVLTLHQSPVLLRLQLHPLVLSFVMISAFMCIVSQLSFFLLRMLILMMFRFYKKDKSSVYSTLAKKKKQDRAKKLIKPKD